MLLDVNVKAVGHGLGYIDVLPSLKEGDSRYASA